MPKVNKDIPCSMRQFKRIVMRKGIDPRTATALRQMHRSAAELPLKEFTEQWNKFCAEHTSWKIVDDLAYKTRFNLRG